MKSGNFNFLETSGPLQDCNGTALPLSFSNCMQLINWWSEGFTALLTKNALFWDKTLILVKGKKVKVALWGFSTLRPFGLLYSYPQQVPAFISRGATHHTDARDFYQRRRELLPMNFTSKSVIYESSLGSFTCRKPGTWDILFYFTSERRYTEDFPDARKIQRLRPVLNPRTRVPVASMLTTRPPKPSNLG